MGTCCTWVHIRTTNGYCTSYAHEYNERLPPLDTTGTTSCESQGQFGACSMPTMQVLNQSQ